MASSDHCGALSPLCSSVNVTVLQVKKLEEPLIQ